ncbi:MAG: alpha/beta hydrolase [Pseudomonadota bacterium]|nr:alpha/beta hydrolase [Pseudomonadota bacterium]
MITTLVILALVALLVLAGPRERVSAPARVHRPDLPGDLDAWLAASEARVSGIRDGLHKEIVWHDPAARAQTGIAVVYLHGFTASKAEVRPVPDRLAAALGANLFYTRLAGHGLDGDALGRVRAEAWLDDTVEAIAIGKRLGQRVVLTGCSTGATLAVWAALHPDLRDDIAALVLVSPNFRINSAAAILTGWPWMRQVLGLLRIRSTPARPDNPAFMHAWTPDWPLTAVLPVGAVVRMVERLDLGAARQPLLVLNHPDDQVVVTAATVAAFDAWGGAPKQRIEVTDCEDAFNHVISGDIVSPGTVGRVSDAAIAFLRGLD